MKSINDSMITKRETYEGYIKLFAAKFQPKKTPHIQATVKKTFVCNLPILPATFPFIGFFVCLCLFVGSDESTWSCITNAILDCPKKMHCKIFYLCISCSSNNILCRTKLGRHKWYNLYREIALAVKGLMYHCSMMRLQSSLL